MKTLSLALWVAAFGCLTAVPFIFIPWTIVENIISWFGLEPIPDNPVVHYMLRTTCGIFSLIGVYFILLAGSPMKYGPMLHLGGYGLILFGLLSLFWGVTIDLSPIIFFGDAFFALSLGIVILILISRLKHSP